MTMQGLIIFAASTFDQQVKAATHGDRFSSRDVLMALTIATIVGFAIVAGVYLHYKKKRDHQDRERLGRKIVSSASSAPRADTVSADTSAESHSGERRRVRKRRRRRDHRPRNPSLQQTGGLPPHRPDDELPKY